MKLESVPFDQSVRELLIRSDLPVQDLPNEDLRLYEARVTGERIGIGGLQRAGSVVLLRSFTIAPQWRGRGLGEEFCRGLLEKAQQLGYDEVYLLTTQASGFFRKLGFQQIERATSPVSIRETKQFRDLCPSAATLMKKELVAG